MTWPVGFRPCRESDLSILEWGGLFTTHRDIIRSAFRRQQERGDLLMLVADLGGYPVGQVWIDFCRCADEGAGFLWAVRVLESMQGAGIGARMIAAAEDVIRGRGRPCARLLVERRNKRARRLCERLGYAGLGELAESVCFTTPDGRSVRMDLDELIMGKSL